MEVEMNGLGLLGHLIECALAAIPHEWDIRWSTQYGTIYQYCLFLMTYRDIRVISGWCDTCER